jgi:hypothetical protein
MDKYLRGDKTQLADGKILTSSRVLTKDDVAFFQEERKTMLLKLQGQPP